jgi:hypothetical protein
LSAVEPPGEERKDGSRAGIGRRLTNLVRIVQGRDQVHALALRRTPPKPDRVFRALLEAADGVAQGGNPVGGLLALARLIEREMVYEHALGELGGGGDRAVEPLHDWDQLVRRYEIRPAYDLGERVWLGWDAVVTAPWSTGRLIKTLERLALPAPRSVGQVDPWSFDSTNHQIAVWLPVRMAEIWSGGNHSVMAGVLSNTGSVPAYAVYDLALLFDRVSTDGIWWVDREEGAFRRVTDWRAATLFEVGRRLRQAGFDGRLHEAEPPLLAGERDPWRAWDLVREMARHSPEDQALQLARDFQGEGHELESQIAFKRWERGERDLEE